MSKKNKWGFTKKQMSSMSKDQLVESIRQMIIKDGTLLGATIEINFSDGTSKKIRARP